MAGRGRGATLPAWMTSGSISVPPPSSDQREVDFADAKIKDAIFPIQERPSEQYSHRSNESNARNETTHLPAERLAQFINSGPPSQFHSVHSNTRTTNPASNTVSSNPPNLPQPTFRNPPQLLMSQLQPNPPQLSQNLPAYTPSLAPIMPPPVAPRPTMLTALPSLAPMGLPMAPPPMAPPLSMMGHQGVGVYGMPPSFGHFGSMAPMHNMGNMSNYFMPAAILPPRAPPPVPQNAVVDPNNDVTAWSEHENDGRKYWFNRLTNSSTYEKV